MKITKKQLRTIIKEAADSYDAEADEWYEYRHQEDQMEAEDYMMDSLYDIVEKNPGLSGDDLIKSAMQDGIFGGKTKEEIFDIADQMVDMSTLKFDLEEDQWWIDRSEDLYSPSHQADLDHANQAYIDKHGDPYED